MSALYLTAYLLVLTYRGHVSGISLPHTLGPSCSPPPLGPAKAPSGRLLLHVLPQLWTTIRTSWHLRVIARRSGSILMNATRECRANIFYYVAHVDYIQYIGGLKPIREGVIFVISTATTAAGELRACATILGMGIIYILAQPLTYCESSRTN